MSNWTSRFKKPKFAVCSGTLIAMWAPLPAYSQVTAAPSSSSEISDGVEEESSEILVTAQGREQQLRLVPITASVASNERIERFSLHDLQALAPTVPSLKIVPGPGADFIVIRGVGSGENAGFEQSVSTFVDGAYRGRGRSIRAALLDVERVEILKGPQTVFFGNNAIAGAIHVITRKAKRERELNASAVLSPNDGEYSIEAGVTTPLNSVAAIRLAAKMFGMNGYSRNVVNGRNGPHERSLAGRASLRLDATPNWQIDARVDVGRDRDNEQGHYQLINCPPPSSYGQPLGVCARELDANGGKIDDKLNLRAAVIPSNFSYDFAEVAVVNQVRSSDLIFKSITTAFHHTFNQLNTVIPATYEGVGGTPFVHNVVNRELADSYAQEFRLESTAGREFEWMLGAFYSKNDFDADLLSGVYFIPLGAAGAPYYDADSPIANLGALKEVAHNRSLFFSTSMQATDLLRVNFGARYSSVTKNARRELVFGTAFPLATFETFRPGPDGVQAQIARAIGAIIGPFDNPRRTDRQLMPSASVQYDVSSTSVLYASYNKGFKSGGFALNSVANEFEPEIVDAFELGIKGSLFDNSLKFSVSTHRSDYRNLQESTADFRLDGSVVFLITNVAASRSQGIDFAAHLRLSDQVSFYADVGYLDALYTSFPDGPCNALQQLTRPAPCVQDLSYKRRAYSPTWSGSVGMSLTMPIEDLVMRADPMVYFSSKYYTQATADPELIQGSYAKLDLRVGVGPRDGKWEVALVGRNLNNRVTGSYRNSLPTSPGTSVALIDRPRSVALQILVNH